MASAETHYTPPLPALDPAPKVLIVVAPYYKDIADALVTGAKRAIEAAGGFWEIAEVPGALEIPPAIGIALRQAEFDAYVALGCVIRGETTHYDTVCNDSSRGLMQLALSGACLGNGILTVENRAQAVVRADPDGQDKGGGAAVAALHLVALGRRFKRGGKPVGFVRAFSE